MSYQELLGLPVALAQEQLALQGITGRIAITAPPRGENDSGTLRVIGVRMESKGPCLVAARFQDGLPET